MAATKTARGPLAEFLHDEAAGGVVLLVATVVALGWANSPSPTATTRCGTRRHDRFALRSTRTSSTGSTTG